MWRMRRTLTSIWERFFFFWQRALGCVLGYIHTVEKNSVLLDGFHINVNDKNNCKHIHMGKDGW